MSDFKMILWVFLITNWTANINDLIKGEWFYHSTFEILFWNGTGILACLCLIFYNQWFVPKDNQDTKEGEE